MSAVEYTVRKTWYLRSREKKKEEISEMMVYEAKMVQYGLLTLCHAECWPRYIRVSSLSRLLEA